MAAKKPVSGGKLSHYTYAIESKAPGAKSWGLQGFKTGRPVDELKGGSDPRLDDTFKDVSEMMKPTVGGIRTDKLEDPLYRAQLSSPGVQEGLQNQNLNGHQFRVRRFPVFQEFKPDGTVGATIRTSPTRNPEAGEVVPMPDKLPSWDDSAPSRPSSAGRMLPVKPHGNTGNPSGNLGKAVGKDPGKNKRARREAAEAAAPKKPAAKKSATKTAAAPAAKKPSAKKSSVTVTPAQLAAEVAKRTGKK